ncbi:MAG: polysaccharide deacetylase family protein [Bacteroidota bacterium]
MLSYRKVFLFTLLGSLVIITLGWASSLLEPWLVFLLILVNLGMLIYGSFYVCSGLYLNVKCGGNKGQKSISITFDDGPDPLITPRVLDLLEEYELKATFFLIGKNIPGNEHLVKRMLDEGHIIGNHSYSHSNYFGFLRSEKVIKDLKKNELLIETICKKKTNLFRPPFGVTNPNIAKAVRSLDYTAIGWNIRSLDGIKKNSAKTTKRVMKRLKPGGIILFHDNHAGIFTILEQLIEKTQKEGYSIVSLDEILNLKTYK